MLHKKIGRWPSKSDDLVEIRFRTLRVVANGLFGPKPATGTRWGQIKEQLSYRFTNERWQELGIPELVDIWQQVKAQERSKAAARQQQSNRPL